MIRNLTKLGVVLALLVMGHTLCRGAEPTPEEQWEWLKLKETPKPAATFVMPKTILPQDETPVAPIVPFSEAELPADQQPTPMEAVTAGLNALNIRKGERIVDFGCGHDARWLITACKRDSTITGVGVEIDPKAAESARRYVAAAELSDRIEIITGDATEVDVQADVGVAYLWPEVLAKLEPKIEKLDRFVSFAHPLPWVKYTRLDPDADVFVYSKPAAVTATFQPPQVQLVRPSAAVWNGRTYTHAVCNRPGCSMCAAIRAQLQPRYVTTTAPQTQSAGRYVDKVVGQRCINGHCTKITQRVWVPN